MIEVETIEKVVEVECVTAFVCNKCGKRFERAPDAREDFYIDEEQEFHRVEIRGSYSSKFPYDLTSLVFDICADCLLEFVESFKVPAQDRSGEPYFREEK